MRLLAAALAMISSQAAFAQTIAICPNITICADGRAASDTLLPNGQTISNATLGSSSTASVIFNSGTSGTISILKCADSLILVMTERYERKCAKPGDLTDPLR